MSWWYLVPAVVVTVCIVAWVFMEAAGRAGDREREEYIAWRDREGK